MSARRLDRPVEPETDARVSRRYRKLADERTPEALDREVLRRASAAAPRSFAWGPPIAAAAVLALAVAVVLDLGRESYPPQEQGDAGAAYDRRVQDETADAPAPTAAPTPLESRSLRSQAEEAASSLGMGEGSASRALGLAAKASVHCTADTADADAWLACIRALEAAGRSEEAAAERRALAARFPGADPGAD